MNAEEAYELSQRQKNCGYGAELSQMNMADMNAVKPIPSAPISQAYSELDNSIQQLQKITEVLTEKLQSVVGPSFPREGDNPEKNAALQTSALAESIRSDAKRIMLVVSRLNDLSQRIEL